MKRYCKSVISVFLVCTLLVTMALFSGVNAADESFKVIVATDLHYRPYSALVPLEEANYLPGDPIYHHTNRQGKLTYEADAILDTFFRNAEASDTEFMLLPGDLSGDGYWEEHYAMVQKLEEFRERSGMKIFVLPGNHDIRTAALDGRLELSDFLDLYADFGYNQALARHDGSASYTAELDDTYRLLAVDVCLYSTDRSQLTPEVLSWTKEQLQAAKNDGKQLIAMVHFNVLDHYRVSGLAGSLVCMEDYRSFATLLADAGVKYVFTGHGHANDIAYAVSQQGNKIFDIETCSLTTYPHSWREVSFSDAAVDVVTKNVEKIDTSLLPQGFSAAQIALMEADFQSYSLHYFRAGYQTYAYQITEMTATLADLLSIAAGSSGYQTLSAVINALGDTIKMPLYGEGSVEEIAKRAGIALEKSEYANLLDLVGMIHAGHYAGDESYTMDSLEVQLLLHAVNAVLLTAFLDMPAQLVNALLETVGLSNAISIPESALTNAAKAVFAQSAAKIFAKEFINLLAGGFISDWSAPGDLNVKLEPYGATQSIEGRATKITNLDFYLEIMLRIYKALYTAVLKIVGMQ